MYLLRFSNLSSISSKDRKYFFSKKQNVYFLLFLYYLKFPVRGDVLFGNKINDFCSATETFMEKYVSKRFLDNLSSSSIKTFNLHSYKQRSIDNNLVTNNEILRNLQKINFQGLYQTLLEELEDGQRNCKYIAVMQKPETTTFRGMLQSRPQTTIARIPTSDRKLVTAGNLPTISPVLRFSTRTDKPAHKYNTVKSSQVKTITAEHRNTSNIVITKKSVTTLNSSVITKDICEKFSSRRNDNRISNKSGKINSLSANNSMRKNSLVSIYLVLEKLNKPVLSLRRIILTIFYFVRDVCLSVYTFFINLF